ncbi:MAG TPA: hypothetical protein VEB19_12690 [Gemmatimonadaceae bacterium]|nr:hypothetical protein [Gemmatimonadaceae bacterium]
MTSTPIPKPTSPKASRLGSVFIGGGALALLGGAVIDFLGGTLANLGSTGLAVLSWQTALYYSGATALVVGAQLRRHVRRRDALRTRTNAELNPPSSQSGSIE